MNIEINIGLTTTTNPDTIAILRRSKVGAVIPGSDIYYRAARTTLRNSIPALTVSGSRVAFSSTERTLVVAGVIENLDQPAIDALISEVAAWCHQDCIAYRLNGTDGYLAGPNAAAWGEFNPAEFLTL